MLTTGDPTYFERNLPGQDMIDFQMEGKTFTRSKSHVEAQANFTEQNTELETQELHKLEDRMAQMKEHADKLARDAHASRERANEAREVANAEAVVPEPEQKKRYAGQLTGLQKIGAFAGNSVSLIDVQKHIARDVKAIRNHLTSRGAGSGGAGGGSPGGFQ
jgi:hypothetical protein